MIEIHLQGHSESESALKFIMSHPHMAIHARWLDLYEHDLIKVAKELPELKRFVIAYMGVRRMYPANYNCLIELDHEYAKHVVFEGYTPDLLAMMLSHNPEIAGLVPVENIHDLKTHHWSVLRTRQPEMAEMLWDKK